MHVDGLADALQQRDRKLTAEVLAELEQELANFTGVFDITNSASAGGAEIKLAIKPEAEALGLTMSSLGRQVRQAFYGEEAQRIQRGKEEIKVMVRYPLEERRSIADLENMRIRTQSGDEVPFESVATVSFGKGYSSISRLNRERTVTVSGNIGRPPMPESASSTLMPLAEEVAPGIGGAAVGGGSDGNFTAAIGVPTLDGLGAVGGVAHADHEFVLAPR